MARCHTLTIAATIRGAAPGEAIELPVGTVVECANGARANDGRWAVVETGSGRVVRTFASQVDRALWIGENTEETDDG
jgi:hypothetical protein